jgi:hypothetical protein
VGELWLPLYSSYIFRALFALIKLNITYQKTKKKSTTFLCLRFPHSVDKSLNLPLILTIPMKNVSQKIDMKQEGNGIQVPHTRY